MIRSAWFPLLLGTLALTACGDDDTLVIPQPEPNPTPSIVLTVEQPSPITANLGTTQGAAGAANILRSEGFNGAITMSAESVPSDWTVSFSPAVLGAGVSSTLVLITAPANVVAGSYSFVVRATAIGITTATREMTVSANVGQGN
jgi:hypothetical protein